jgi:lipopolysaccharide biosynthesis regulator YciM
MDFESWWLIFVPLLFGLGWLAARFDFRQMLTETRSLPDSYFKGLNFLLNEQPDRAIDAFVEVAKLDPETTELHFALGSLFRRRGEMERAIRVHQSLLSRSDLPTREREHALHEIAQDYLKAGMLDRAEMAYKELKNTRYEEPARRALVRIYESEHDWPAAIEAVRKLANLAGESVPQEVHYHCEMLQSCLNKQVPDLDGANRSLQQALACGKSDGDMTPASRARILMLSAALARARNDAASERDALLEILEKAPEYAGLIAAELEKSFSATAQSPELLERFLVHYGRYPSLDLFDVIFKLLKTHRGPSAAWAFARHHLAVQPSLLGLDRVLAADASSEPADGTAGEAAGEVAGGGVVSSDLLRRLVGKHTQRLDRYACRVCGFQAKNFYWQCPGCHGWETYRPRRLEELQ